MQAVPRISPLTGTNHELADEGSYYVAKTAVGGLATIAAQSSLADTAPFIVVKSGPANTVKGRRRFDYLRLTCVTPGTGSTAIKFAVRTDATKADPTAGSSLTPLCPNQDIAPATDTTIFAGPLLAVGATGAMRELYSQTLRPVIPVAGDVYHIKFGGPDAGVGNAPGGAAAAAIFAAFGPLIIGPNQWCAFHVWSPGQTVAATYEAELGFWERG